MLFEYFEARDIDTTQLDVFDTVPDDYNFVENNTSDYITDEDIDCDSLDDQLDALGLYNLKKLGSISKILKRCNLSMYGPLLAKEGITTSDLLLIGPEMLKIIGFKAGDAIRLTMYIHENVER